MPSDSEKIDDELESALQEAVAELDSELSPDELAEMKAKLRREMADIVRERASARVRQALQKRGPRPAPRTEPAAAEEEAEEEFERLTLLMRIQHIVLFSSCIILIVTGLPLKFPDSAFAKLLFGVTHGIRFSGILHRIGATGLIAVSAFHMGYIAFAREGKELWRHLFPRLKDVLDVLGNVKYFLGFSREPARFGRFSYIEKFDYWAVYWGCVVMILSGALLWFQDQAMRLLPKLAVDMAKEGMIERRDALRRVPAGDLSQLLLPRFLETAKRQALADGRLLGRGLNASPG
ncbi:MAG: cytochrome b/b6 domain-containing protein, partial [Armatimonadota bacterium]